MVDDHKKRGASDRRRVSAGQGYEVSYFARASVGGSGGPRWRRTAPKHGITAEKAREIIGRVGNDRDKLNATAERAQ